MRVVLSLLCLSFPLAANAERTTIFSKGSWVVEYVSSDDVTWCEATTTNQQNQTFDLTAFASGDFTIYVWDANWDIESRPVSFIIDIDYSRWNMDGTASGKSVSVTPSDATKTVDFLSDLKRGRAVALYNDDEFRLATFSLSGSSAAIDSLMDCWEKTSPLDTPASPSDPFATTSDPFI
ncbi:hypothetical protein [Palleronia marisminoris]|uniref:hypothetical protein n=1 Tax=Palleronia marisminoris TaxID=315423 RepID=UPI0011135205|nr:hypothetical protein [Palleronia marisminoris]